MATLLALLYTQEAAHNPNRDPTYKFKEIWVGEPYNLIINYCPDSLYDGNNLHIFRSKTARLVINPTFVSEPKKVVDATDILVSKEWVEECMQVLITKETLQQRESKLILTKPDELKMVY